MENALSIPQRGSVLTYTIEICMYDYGTWKYEEMRCTTTLLSCTDPKELSNKNGDYPAQTDSIHKHVAGETVDTLYLIPFSKLSEIQLRFYVGYHGKEFQKSTQHQLPQMYTIQKHICSSSLHIIFLVPLPGILEGNPRIHVVQPHILQTEISPVPVPPANDQHPLV